MLPTLTAERLTAAERREQILRAAIGVFAEHGYEACDDPEIRELMATGFGGLWDLVRRLSGADAAQVSRFFANGMLLNVLAMMGQFTKPQRWASELIVGCASDA